MATNFTNSYAADVIGLWDFRHGQETEDTGLDDGIAQDGTTAGCPSFCGGWMLTGGHYSRLGVHGDDTPFDLTEGTIITEFKEFNHLGTEDTTVVSRGEADCAFQDGFFEIRVTAAGAVEVYHADGGQDSLLSTGDGFLEAKDVIKVSYSWSATKGPQLQVENITQGTTATDSSDVTGLTLDVTANDGESFSIAAREATDGDYDQHFNGGVDYVAVLDKPVIGQGDGIVDGSAGDDLIDLAYTGDPEGDMIDAGDALLPGEAPDDDIVDARAGDDVIKAGVGDDDVYAGSGSDTVYGESGDDVIWGDSNSPDGTGETVRESFEWDLAPDPDSAGDIDDGDDLSGGFSQNTGTVDVTYSVVQETSGVDTEFTSYDQYVANVDTDGGPADANSALYSVLNGQVNSADYKLDFSDPVLGVSFRINDIDGDGVVQVTAFDSDGQPVTVNLSGGPKLTLSDEDAVPGMDTADSNGGYEDEDSPTYSLLVSIPGPVSSLVISHDQDGENNSGVTVTDVYFDVPVADTAADGDDILHGGDGDDTIYGEGGNDTITGGNGADTVDGGDGDDFIDTRGSLDSNLPDSNLPDRGFPSYNGLPSVPVDSNVYDDRDTVDGGAGDDVILTGDDVDVIAGGAGNDTIDGGLDDDIIDGGADDDLIVGGEGADTIDGGTGNDTIYGGLDPAFPDYLNIRDDGTDGPADPDPTNGMDIIDGGDGDDVIFGQDDDDTLHGGSGNDFVDGGIDNDTIFGGSGDDILLGGQGTDVVSGDSGDDVIIGGSGADTLLGGDDSDIIGAGVGDTIEGGEGGTDLDTLIANGLATVEYTGGDPSSEAGTVTFYNADLSVAGTADFSEIEQVLVVGTSPQSVSTGLSTGTLEGVVDGTSGDDVIDLAYTGDPEGDMIDNDDAVLPLVDEQDVVRAGAGNDIVQGFDDTDVIFGGSGNDTLQGNGGDDAIDGGRGDDIIDGGEGRDILVGGEGNDTISGSVTTAGDGGDLMFGGFGDDTFVNIGLDEVIDGGEDADGLDIDRFDPSDLQASAEAISPGGSFTITRDTGNPENGTITFFDSSGSVVGTSAFVNIEMPCFTPGTLIATPKGERRVEDLQVGDRVITRDNGIQEIRWMGQRSLNGRELAYSEHLNPVLIRQGALGSGLPERDMMVSPNHRVLVSNDKTALYFEDREVLVSAKHLTGLPGVDVVEVSDITYIHFMCDQHEVVLSDGAWTESFQPGDQSLKGIGNAQRNEIYELFPELKTSEGKEAYQAARRSLKKHEALLLVQ